MSKPRCKPEYVWEWYREERPWVRHSRLFVRYFKNQINRAKRRHDRSLCGEEV